MDLQPPSNPQTFTSYSINQTHNLVLQNIVQNHQIKFAIFHEIQHIKMLYKNGQEHRFLTGLVVAGRNFIKVYALFSGQVWEELAFYKIHQDITALYSWEKQKCIIIETKQKVVGLAFQEGILKNAFMLSLQFLPLNPNDACKCAFDRRGFMFTILIKNFLLICFSNQVIRKKGKPVYKEFTEIVSEDIKWNRSERTYVQQVIKIKISDFELCKIENMNICNEALYFIGLKNFQKPNEKQEFNQKAFYHIQAPFFFDDKHPQICQFLAKKDPQVSSMIPYVHNNQMECLFCKKDSIYVQIGKDMVLVDQFEDGDYSIVHRNTGEGFSLWVRVRNSVVAYYRNGSSFVIKVIGVNFYFDNFLLKEEAAFGQGTIIYSNQTELCAISIDLSFAKRLISPNNNKTEIEQEISLNDKNSTKLHKSFGNITDFQFGKNSIFMVESRLGVDETMESKFQIKSKVYELRRALVTDPRPFITHEKKNFLQDLLNKQKLKSLKTIKFRFSQPASQQYQNIYTDNVIIAQSHSYQNMFTFYRELMSDTSKQKAQGFEMVIEGVSHYGKVTFEEIDYLVMINEKGQYWIERDCSVKESSKFAKSIKKLMLEEFPVGKTQLIKNIFFIDSLIIYQISQSLTSYTFYILDIFTLTDARIQLPVNSNILQLFMTKKLQSFRKKDKNSLVIQITVIYPNSLQIFQLYPMNKDLRLVYKSQNISKGLPYLSNYINHNVENKSIFQKDKLRSITCPQYILSEYHTTVSQQTIKTAALYTYRDVTYLVLINSLSQFIVYRKCLSFQNECGIVYRRVVLPLNIVKVFRYHEENEAIDQIGEGMVKVCNVLICKGQFLEHNVHHVSYFQMDSCLWTIEKEKIKMIDIKPLAGSNQPLFRQTYRKDSKDFAHGGDFSRFSSNTLQDNIEIMSNFILTPIRTMMRKQLMGLEISGDYFMIYSKSGFEVLNQKEMKPVWACNLSSQNPQRKEVIVNAKLYDHYIAVSYYDYILDQNTEFKSIKFKFRIYNILSKKKILEKPKSTDEPILHIRPISAEKILLATSTTLFIYQIKAEKSLEPIRTRNFSKRFGLSTFSYIPEVFDEKNRSHKPCYMLLANQFGGLSFFVGKWIEGDILREMWFQKIRCQIRNVQLFHYGEELKGLITDEDGNLIVINLKPDTPEQPAKAQKLADINVGSKANVLRIRHQQDRKIYACFQDGTIKSISAVKLDNPEVSLIDFQEEAFCKEIPFMGGFNQRVSRLMHQKYRTYKYVSRGNIVDCQILEEFFSTTVNLKEYILEKSELKLEQLKAVIRSI